MSYFLIGLGLGIAIGLVPLILFRWAWFGSLWLALTWWSDD